MRARLHVSPIVLAVVLGSCATHRSPAIRPASWTVHRHDRPQANFTLEEQQRIEKNCPFGYPRIDPDVGWGPTHFVIREGYVLEHSSELKIPLWVCEGIVRAQLDGSIPRKDAFQPDPLLPPGERAELKDYKNSGYDRGHMAPAGDQTVDPQLKEETFFLSNMAPQEGALNQQIWRELEDKAREWLQSRGAGFIVTGSLFYEPEEEDPNTADGFINYFTIGTGLVAVPTHFYKIVAAQNADGSWDTIGFVMENRKYARPYRWEDHIQAIDWIEERAGLDFMPDLDPVTEQQLESTPSSLWSP